MSRNCIYCSTDGESCGRVTATATPRCCGMCSATTNGHPLVLDIGLVGIILGRARHDQRPLLPTTVSAYVYESRPGRRYADHPFPTPDGYVASSPIWEPGRVDEILDWAHKRPGQGAGGGRPRRTIRP